MIQPYIKKENLRKVRQKLSADLIRLREESGMSWDELYDNFHITEAKMKQLESMNWIYFDLAYLSYLATVYNKELKIEFV